jgi:predicted peroxiredoxin
MSSYVLVESRDPFDSRDSEHFYEIARGLKDAGNEVTLFLVQNGVLPTRRESTYATKLTDLAGAQVTILADAFSLKERAIGDDDLVASVKSSDVDHLVDLLMAGNTKAIWH